MVLLSFLYLFIHTYICISLYVLQANLNIYGLLIKERIIVPNIAVVAGSADAPFNYDKCKAKIYKLS